MAASRTVDMPPFQGPNSYLDPWSPWAWKITYKTAIAYADSANDVRLRIKAEGVGAPVEEEAGKSAFKLRSEVSRT